MRSDKRNTTALGKKLRAAFVKNYPEKVPDKIEVSVQGTPIVTQFTVDMRKAVSLVVTADNVKALFELHAGVVRSLPHLRVLHAFICLCVIPWRGGMQEARNSVAPWRARNP